MLNTLHCLRYSTHSFPTIPESIFYDASTISRVGVLRSSNKSCYEKNGASRLAKDYRVASPPLAFSLWLSDFKTKISFGFPFLLRVRFYRAQTVPGNTQTCTWKQHASGEIALCKMLGNQIRMGLGRNRGAVPNRKMDHSSK